MSQNNNTPLLHNAFFPSNYRIKAFVILGSLFLSGVAGIINQVVWQRALKIFLGGSEALSSMIVVFVFMFGLGFGAAFMGKQIHKISHPIRFFGLIELLLFIINILIAIILGLDISESIYAAQRMAVAIGIPIRVVYTFGALIILIPPAFLMGTTLPIASEVFQRQLGATKHNLITIMFFINTAGAALGSFGGSFYLLPFYGQKTALFFAGTCNLFASVLLLSLSYKVLPKKSSIIPSVTSKNKFPLCMEEQLGAILGFLSLGYEIYLFRIMALAHLPLPYTFATTLCFFLLLWSIGVFISTRIKGNIATHLIIVLFLVISVHFIYQWDRKFLHFHMYGGVLLYFTPCLFFGILYGKLVSGFAKNWGRDVARFYAINTLGSCFGILFFTLLGYNMPNVMNTGLISTGILFTAFHYLTKTFSDHKNDWIKLQGTKYTRVARIISILGFSGLIFAGLFKPITSNNNMRSFWGRDGVIEIKKRGGIYIDGLWHSRLSNGKNHIGMPYSWYMAIASYTAHKGPVTDALIIGNGIGITATTLSKMGDIKIDAYEINHTFKKVIETYPAGTLHVDKNPNINIIWQDARSGLALNKKKYDIIISAPLHLKQSGSSLLLSQEYFKLLKSRLKQDGVVALYSHEGIPRQSALIRSTVRSVFLYGETFLRGIITLVSDSPIKIEHDMMHEKLRLSKSIYKEVTFYQKTRKRDVYSAYDSKRLSWDELNFTITDNHPLIEYPKVIRILLNDAR